MFYQFNFTPIAFRRTFKTPVHDTGFPSAWLPELLQYDDPPEIAAAGPKSPEPRYTLEALALSNAASCSADAWDTTANTRHVMRMVGPMARTLPQQLSENKRCRQKLGTPQRHENRRVAITTPAAAAHAEGPTLLQQHSRTRRLNTPELQCLGGRHRDIYNAPTQEKLYMSSLARFDD